MSNVKSDLILKIEADFLEAFKTKDGLKLSVLRLLKSALENKQKEKGETVDKETVIRIIQSEIKKRDQAIQGYEKAGRPESSQREAREKKILQNYLPKPMAEEKIIQIIDLVIARLDNPDIKQMGQVIGQVMGQTKGQAPGELVSRLVKQKLSHG